MADAKPEAAADTRGQVSVELDGQEYLLRPSFEAIAACERQLRPLYQLATEASRGELSLDDMGVIVAEMMRAQGKADPDGPLAADYKGARAERCSQLVYEAGAPGVCARLMVVLIGALNGGYDAKGEAKAPATTPETPAGA